MGCGANVEEVEGAVITACRNAFRGTCLRGALSLLRGSALVVGRVLGPCPGSERRELTTEMSMKVSLPARPDNAAASAQGRCCLERSMAPARVTYYEL